MILEVPLKSRVDTPGEEYPLCKEADSSGPSPWQSPHERWGRYLPVVCPVCATRMYATMGQVGQEMECPDCRTKTRVSAPPEAPVKKPGQARPIEDYPLCEEVDAMPGVVRAAQQQHIATHCPLCDTLVQATIDQVGQKIVCPDCGTPTVVPPPPPPVSKHHWREEEGEYRVREPRPSARQAMPVGFSLSRPRPGYAVPDEIEHRRARGVPLPRWPFLSGVFGLPLCPGVRLRWLALSVVAALVLYAVYWAYILAASMGGGIFAAGFGIGSLVLTGTAVVLGAMWAAVMTVVCLAILNDTAAGNDRVENWPDALWFVDWIGEVFYVVNSLALSILPGLGLAWLLDWQHQPSWFCVPLGMAVLFPVILLSMLERNTPLSPFSPPLWRSFLNAWWAWALFYVDAAVLLIGAGGAVVFALTLLEGAAIPVAAFLLVAALMVYFRLLGRLAHCCTAAALPAARPPADRSREHEVEEERRRMRAE